MIVLNKKLHSQTFEEVTNKFPILLQKIKSQEKYLIDKYFKPDFGVKSICKLLKLENDFEGLYIFYKNGKPFYTGISGNVIKRIKQHVKGKDHFTSSLCYKIGSSLYENENNHKHSRG